MKYTRGSDKKTVDLARELYGRVIAAQDRGDWQEAERLIQAGARTPNQPLRAEFAMLCCDA